MLKNRMPVSNKTWENVVYKLIILIFILITGFLGGIVYVKLTAPEISNPISLKINDFTKNNRLDSLAVIKLENEIKLVETKNDGRFEVLTWSATLLISILLILMGINFISSNAKAEDAARDEIDKKSEDIKESLDKELIKIKNIRSGLEDLQIKAESDMESIITLINSKNKGK